jgi:hypothetical protein
MPENLQGNATSGNLHGVAAVRRPDKTDVIRGKRAILPIVKSTYKRAQSNSKGIEHCGFPVPVGSDQHCKPITEFDFQ